MPARGSFGRRWAWALALGPIATACGGDTASTGAASLTGGTAGTATDTTHIGGAANGSGGTDQQSMGGGATGGTKGAANPCDDVAACGGDVVGTWNVQSSCVEVSGRLDLSSTGIGCRETTITGGSLQVTGTFTANGDGTYMDNTTTTGSEQFTLEASCLILGEETTCARIGTPLGLSLGFASCTCTDATGGGCNCSATVQHTAGMGTVNYYASRIGNYASSGNVLSINDGTKDWPYSYCVSANTLTMTPEPTGGPACTGSIVLQRQ